MSAYGTPQTLSAADRKTQLAGWEFSRKSERAMVKVPLWYSFVGSLFSSAFVYWAAARYLAVGQSVCLALLVSTFPFWLWLASYLQTWGSYVERRIEELEAKIDGRLPIYYMAEDEDKFAEQPLHERLARIEELLSRLEPKA